MLSQQSAREWVWSLRTREYLFSYFSALQCQKVNRRTAEPNIRDITKLAMEEGRKTEKQLLDIRRKALDQFV